MSIAESVERVFGPLFEDVQGVVDALTRQKDGAYRERDQLVALLSKVFPSHLAIHEKEWEEEVGWSNIVCVHLPTGDASWHIPDSELPMFSHLVVRESHFDGHTTEEKYERLAAYVAEEPF